MKKQWHIPRWVETFQVKAKKQAKEQGAGPTGFVYYLGLKKEQKRKEIIQKEALDFQKEALLKSEKDTLHFVGLNGPVWLQRSSSKKDTSHGGVFAESSYGQARDGIGSLVAAFKSYGLKEVIFEFWGATSQEQVGALVGLELGSYSFRALNENTFDLDALPKIHLSAEGKAFAEKTLKDAQALAYAINWARHLVNLPGQDLNPHSFEVLCEDQFKKSKTTKVEVWDEYRLQKEKMQLHLAVGQGAHFGPRMVHLRYRPLKAKKAKPLAIVGKGVTFDSGGLDIKPSSAMRLMKKDMGGAAVVFALALWLEETQFPQACDLYLGIAENAVGPRSFRPGDIFKARNGLSIEIHNTDAEGRLVLADVLDVAVKNKETPEAVIDLATLTGAIKVALGADLPGLFSNNDYLAKKLEEAGVESGEPCWRMPLVPKYRGQMSSSVASLTNAVDGFGGAITAALFLENFVGAVPWAHLDIYAWNDRPAGGLTFAGGSGQGVQTMVKFLEQWKGPVRQKD